MGLRGAAVSRLSIEEIKEALDLENWFERESRPCKLTHGRSGWQLQVQECPACGKRSWKVYLNAETGVGNCFSCEVRFTKLGFIKEALGLSEWRDVFRHCEEVLREQGYRTKRRVEIAVEVPTAKLPRSIELPTLKGNLEYLAKRDITDELTRYFHLRYSSGGVWLFDREDGSKGSQDFSERLIIPVFDLNGELATFQGRDLTGASETRYLFPKGLPGTGRYLLNGQNVKGQPRLAMGEGAFDIMSIRRAFDEKPATRDVGVVGSFGKHLSYGAMDGDDQLGRFIQLKAAGLKEVTIMWDGGQKELIAALDAAKILHGVSLAVRIARLPQGYDPNEITLDAVREAFHQAMKYSRIIDMQWRLKNPYSRAA